MAAAGSPEVIEFNRHTIDRWVAATGASGAATAEQIEGGKQATLAQFGALGRRLIRPGSATPTDG